MLLVGTLVWGAWAPTPSWYQYFYPIAPLMILASVIACGEYQDMRAGFLPAVCAICLLTTSLAGARHYAAPYLDETESETARVRRIGLRISELVPDGTVLTLAPLFALQAKREIYPWLATGPFSWRTAPFVDADRRSALGLVGPDEFDAVLARQPPSAVLVGIEVGDVEERAEAPLSTFARAARFERHDLGDGVELWTESER
jgi:hypothetical protein